MNRHHTGSGRRRMIPADWGANHAAVVATSRNATVTLRKPPTTAFVDRATTAVPGAAYATDVSARIQERPTLTRDVDAAEETVPVSAYLVAVDFGIDEAQPGDEVYVTACPGDPALVGRTLRVDDAELGTERFERDLFCTLNDVQPTT